MSEVTVPWEEHLRVVREAGRLRGAIEAHRIISEVDERRGKPLRIQDTIMYGLAGEEDDA